MASLNKYIDLAKDDILKEFEEYSHVDYRDNFSIGVIYSHYEKADEERNGNRGFSIITKRGYYLTETGIQKQENIRLFALTLKEYGNFEYARKIHGIGWSLAKYYADLLNREAKARGLPLIFKRKKCSSTRTKLNAKQVSYIKYLVTKLSSYQVAAMYSVCQGTIHLIKHGITWKEVNPAIYGSSTIKIINQYAKEISKPSETSIIIAPSHEALRIRLEQNRWGIGKSICPFCKHHRSYYSQSRQRYKCAGCYRKFTLYTGTIYEGTQTTLDVWYKVEKALELNLSQLEAAKIIGISQKSIWRLMNVIKHSPFKSLIMTEWTVPLQPSPKTLLS